MQQKKETFSSADLKESKPNNTKLLSMAPFLMGLLIFGYIYSKAPLFGADASIEQEIKKLVNLHYVDDKNLPEKSDSLSINHWLDQLDPHTYYLSPKRAKQTKNELAGVRVGIGVQLQFGSDTPLIVYVVPNSPAAKQGVLPGDRIVAVNGTPISKIATSDTSVFDRVLGTENTPVKITFYNAHFDRKQTKTLTRAAMNYSSTSEIFMTNNHVGYAKFNLFTSNSHEELIDSLSSLKNQGMEHLILDLRGNGGGVLDQAVSIANEFLEKNQLITFTKGLRREKEIFKANGEGKFLHIPMVILTNQQSASASEILAAALKENQRSITMGDHTFGKGLVQETYILSNGGSLNMTISRYYTPNGKSIQRNYPYIKNDTNYGVLPNIKIKASAEIAPTYLHYLWATDHGLYQKNWKARYTNSTQFANAFCNDTDSFLYYVALGTVIYGPNELPNFVLRKDPVFSKARKILTQNN